MKASRLGLSTGFVFLLLMPSLLTASDATHERSGAMGALMPMVTDSPLAGLETKGLSDSIRKLVAARFDFADMARRSLGLHWRLLNPGEQKQFVDDFAQRLMGYHGGTMGSSGGEAIRVKGDIHDGKQARIEALIVTRYGEYLPIKYWLEEVNGQWKVYDVMIDHVGVVENFRAQFERVIAKSSVKELLQQLKDRSPGS
jgi:phospholipid transport system substrate-binding protein